jgi:hypothetical protein
MVFELFFERRVSRCRIWQTLCFTMCAVPDAWEIWPGMGVELGMLSMVGWATLLSTLASKKATIWLVKPLYLPWENQNKIGDKS